jgi:hypothetical protein
VQFDTDHFTSFVLGDNECSFVINNDDPSTASTAVTLNIECRVATDMKFANSQRDLETAPWAGRFRDTVSWTIEGVV